MVPPEGITGSMIYGLLIFTACFFLGLMFLTLSAYADFPRMTVTH